VKGCFGWPIVINTAEKGNFPVRFSQRKSIQCSTSRYTLSSYVEFFVLCGYFDTHFWSLYVMLARFWLLSANDFAKVATGSKPSIMLDCGPQGSDALTAHHTTHACTPAYACDQGIRTVCGGIITIGLVFSESAQPCRQQPPKDAQGVLCKPVTTLRRFLYYSFFYDFCDSIQDTLSVEHGSRAVVVRNDRFLSTYHFYFLKLKIFLERARIVHDFNILLFWIRKLWTIE
jgi:hypothetical protein